jgi:hypothetical protein
MSANDPKRTLPTATQPIRINATKGGIMQFDIDKMAALDRFELLLGTVVPRPIALVTTLGEDGTLNSAPYSQFTVLSHDPPLLLHCRIQIVGSRTQPKTSSRQKNLQ